MSRKALWLTLAVLCLAGCFAAVVIAPTGSPESPDEPAVIDVLRLVGYDESGDPEWVLVADSGQLMQETQTGSFSMFTLEFFDGGGATLSVTAGRVNLTSQRGILTQSPSVGTVPSASRAGEYTLCADRMTWWREEDTLAGTDVSSSFSSGRLTAPVMELDLITEHLHFDGGILMNIDLEDGKVAEVSGEAATIVDDQIIIERSVVVAIASDTYHCEAMTLQMTKDDTSVSSIHMEGDVSASLSQGEITADTLRVTADGWEAGGRVHIEFEVDLDESWSARESDA